MFYYQINCVCVADGELIHHMMDNSTEITYRTFRKNVDKDNFLEVERNLGYDRNLRMLNDWHVRYYKSKIKGHPVYYFVWSAIEYIFTKDEFPVDLFFQNWEEE
jgi:hypothetical protein